MEAFFKCFESLPDSSSDNSPSCELFFSEAIQNCTNTGLLDDYRMGASYLPVSTYAQSVQKNQDFIALRERAYIWMINVLVILLF